MTLDETLLQKLAKWRFHSGRQTLEAAAADAKATLTADCADQVGCRVWELALSRPAPAASLADRAQRLAGRATGLLEPLRLLEVDAEGRTALLRSDRPTLRDGQLGYYEVLLQADGGASVRRYQAPQTPGRREQIGYNLTHEALAKLVSDLNAC
jgi:hypothetical protein